MLSKQTIKYIRSFQDKKYRKIHRQFVIEGDKIVKELLMLKDPDYSIDNIYALPGWIETNKELLNNKRVEAISNNELKKISTLSTPNQVLALVNIPEKQLKEKELDNTLSIGLDDIRDPGNLGTIIRIAAWFGIKYIICSHNSVDVYNPKVVQATMGAIFHVDVFTNNLTSFIKKQKNKEGYTIYGTFLEGNNIYKTNLNPKGIIVMGNESHGIKKEIEQIITTRLFIPKYCDKKNGAESLNISIATGIICSEFKRRIK
jgi:TrmH family RNA methyltransferase